MNKTKKLKRGGAAASAPELSLKAEDIANERQAHTLMRRQLPPQRSKPVIIGSIEPDYISKEIFFREMYRIFPSDERNGDSKTFDCQLFMGELVHTLHDPRGFRMPSFNKINVLDSPPIPIIVDSNISYEQFYIKMFNTYSYISEETFKKFKLIIPYLYSLNNIKNISIKQLYELDGKGPIMPHIDISLDYPPEYEHPPVYQPIDIIYTTNRLCLYDENNINVIEQILSTHTKGPIYEIIDEEDLATGPDRRQLYITNPGRKLVHLTPKGLEKFKQYHKTWLETESNIIYKEIADACNEYNKLSPIRRIPLFIP